MKTQFFWVIPLSQVGRPRKTDGRRRSAGAEQLHHDHTAGHDSSLPCSLLYQVWPGSLIRMIVIIVTALIMLPSYSTLASWHLTALLVPNCDDEPEEASCYCDCDCGRQEFWNADTGEIICNMTAAYGDEKWDVTTSNEGFGNFAWDLKLNSLIKGTDRLRTCSTRRTTSPSCPASMATRS